jgi:hypothetical protein
MRDVAWFGEAAIVPQKGPITMAQPSVTMRFGPIMKEYGAFRLRNASLLLCDGRLLRTLSGYQITLARPSQEDDWVTTVYRNELPAILAAVHHRLELHEHMLNSWRETLELFEHPDGRARLQATIDEKDSRDARAGAGSHPRLKVDQVIANQRVTYEVETRRHRRIEEALSDLEAHYPTTRGEGY